MCRYAYKTYKPHYVCFACRKQFKRPRIDDVMAHLGKLHLLQRLDRARSIAELEEAERAIGVTRNALSAQYHARVSRCPQCGGEMADLGLDFKPPPMSALRVWNRLRTVHRMGHHWRTCGCNGPGFVPTTRPEMRRYLAERSEMYARNAERARRDETKTPEARAEAHAYWAECRRRVDRERGYLEGQGARLTRHLLRAQPAYTSSCSMRESTQSTETWCTVASHDLQPRASGPSETSGAPPRGHAVAEAPPVQPWPLPPLPPPPHRKLPRNRGRHQASRRERPVRRPTQSRGQRWRAIATRRKPTSSQMGSAPQLHISGRDLRSSLLI